MPLPKPPGRSEGIPNGPFSFLEDPNPLQEAPQPAEKPVRKAGRRRARFENGRFVADNPATETVNEAWELVTPGEEQE